MAKYYDEVEITGVVDELDSETTRLKNGMFIEVIKTIFSTDELDETVKGYQVLIYLNEEAFEEAWYDSISVLTKKEVNEIIKDCKKKKVKK